MPDTAPCCALSAAGCAHLLHGGQPRFPRGDGFARAAGLKLLPEPAVIELGGVPTLLLHGDTLCTDDAAYQAFRSEVRSPDWRQAFLALPLVQRKARSRSCAARARPEARQALDIMDVNARTPYHGY
jgi:UDP-2,3-diacylglucosamine hydrolase